MSDLPIQRLVPSLWFDHVAAEASAWYVETFRSALGPLAGDESVTGVVATSRYPTEGLAPFQAEFAGEVLEVRYRLVGLEHSAINAGPEFPINPAISMTVLFDPELDPRAEQHLRTLHAELTDSGGELMELSDQYPFAPLYSWVRDRYGMTWQLMIGTTGAAARVSELGAAGAVLGERAGGRSPVQLVPTLMFPHGSGFGRPALTSYVELFDRVFSDSGLGELAVYPPEAGQGEDALLHGTAVLAGRPLAAMDSGVPQSFSFDCSVSLLVQCDDQAQIDAVWEALSAVPEAEACGWCRDRFGVSWQVAPVGVSGLMARPGAWQVMTSQKKPVLAAFEALPEV